MDIMVPAIWIVDVYKEVYTLEHCHSHTYIWLLAHRCKWVWLSLIFTFISSLGVRLEVRSWACICCLFNNIRVSKERGTYLELVLINLLY